MYDYADDLPGGVLIRPGAIGSFEVYLDDRRVFSKLNDERFPEANEVEEQLGTLLMAT